MEAAEMLSRTCLAHWDSSQMLCSRIGQGQKSVGSQRSVQDLRVLISRQTLGAVHRGRHRSRSVTMSQRMRTPTCGQILQFPRNQANHHDVRRQFRRPAVVMSQGRLDPPPKILVAAFVSAVLSRNWPKKTTITTQDAKGMTPMCNAGVSVESTAGTVSSAASTYDIESNTDWLAGEADRLRSMQAGTP